MNDRVFALFFTTQGKSLENWERLGMFEREVKLYRHTASHFKTIYFFTYGVNDGKFHRDLPDNIVVVSKPRYIPTMLYSFLLPLVHWKKLKDVDIYKTNQMDGSWTAVLAKKLYGGTLIIRCGYEWLQFIERANRGKLKRMFARWAERFAYNNADVIVHTSKEAAAFARERFSVPDEKVRIIPNFIDTELFKPLGSEKEKSSLVFVGRLEPQKNLYALINALEGLPVSLTVIGTGSQQKELQELAVAKNVSVTWKGTVSQPNLPEELNKHAMFVLPSLYEGSPKTLLEAMSCGLACIASDVLGNREVVQDKDNGLLCGTDAASIREAIQLLHTNEQFRHQLEENARRTILATYSFEKVFEQELSVYTART